MDNFRGLLDYIRGFFSGPWEVLERPRKRRALDHYDGLFNPPKFMKLSTMHRSYNDDSFQRKNCRQSRGKPPRQVETIVLDDDEDEIKRPALSRFTSTPSDDDVKFVKEFKSPMYSQRPLRGNHLKSFDGSYLDLSGETSTHNGTKSRYDQNSSSHRNGTGNSRHFTSSSLDYSFRLDDKLKYKQLLESAGSNTTNGTGNNSSLYETPVGKFLANYDGTRASRILGMSVNKSGKKSPNDSSSGRLSTKDRIIKVLDDFEEPVVVPDSDSDSDVIILPPSPKPDITVDPVNSLRKVVDTSESSKSTWLNDMVQNHQRLIEDRQKEIEDYRQSANKHSQINRDLRLALITNKINKSLIIKDVVLPVHEKDVELPELSNEQLKIVQRAFSGNPNEILANKFNLTISRRDIQTLAGLNWLNDEVINFYMNLIIERGKDSKWPKVYAMNTFFYMKLIKDGPQSLRRWTRKVDIFAHDLICVPIHLGMHWCMAVIDLRQKTIRYYDSMGSSNNKCLEALRNYLQAEHLDKKKEDYDVSKFVLENVKDIPQQMNGSDCGMFSCTFAEFISRGAKITFSQEDMPYLRKKMVVEIVEGYLLIQ